MFLSVLTPVNCFLMKTAIYQLIHDDYITLLFFKRNINLSAFWQHEPLLCFGNLLKIFMVCVPFNFKMAAFV